MQPSLPADRLLQPGVAGWPSSFYARMRLWPGWLLTAGAACRYRSPMQLSTLMAQFDAVMTPGPRMSLGGNTPGPVVEISALRNVPARCL